MSTIRGPGGGQAAPNHLLDLPHINTEEAERVATKLPFAAQSMDFADALHLVGSVHCTTQDTFMMIADSCAGPSGSGGCEGDGPNRQAVSEPESD